MNIRFLDFARESRRIGSRRVRTARFENRSLLPVSAACVVANGIRELIGEFLGAPASVRLFEPLLPDAMGWSAIAADARIYSVRGSLASGALVLRAADALRLAGAAFGEADSRGRALSPMETRALDRMVEALCAHLAPVCGGGVERPRPLETLVGFSTYFEVQIDEPLRARIGVALSSEPVVERGAGLTLDDVRNVQVDVAVQLGQARLAAADLAGLRVGSVLALGRVSAPLGIAVLAGRALGRGECGVRGGRYALSVGALIREGSNEPSL